MLKRYHKVVNGSVFMGRQIAVLHCDLGSIQLGAVGVQIVNTFIDYTLGHPPRFDEVELTTIGLRGREPSTQAIAVNR